MPIRHCLSHRELWSSIVQSAPYPTLVVLRVLLELINPCIVGWKTESCMAAYLVHVKGSIDIEAGSDTTQTELSLGLTKGNGLTETSVISASNQNLNNDLCNKTNHILCTIVAM